MKRNAETAFAVSARASSCDASRTIRRPARNALFGGLDDDQYKASKKRLDCLLVLASARTSSSDLNGAGFQ
jgi:hypothetical protein